MNENKDTISLRKTIYNWKKKDKILIGGIISMEVEDFENRNPDYKFSNVIEEHGQFAEKNFIIMFKKRKHA
jgi:hypothetical protein